MQRVGYFRKLAEIFNPLLFLLRHSFLLILLALPGWLSSQCDFTGELGLDCLEAPLLSAADLSSGEVFCATLPSSNPILELSSFCNGLGTSENTGFLKFYPGSSALSFLLEPISCDTVDNSQGVFTGLQIAVFPACDFGNPILCEAACQNSPINLNLSNLIPGALYALAIDGCNGSVCSIGLEITSGELMNIDPTGEPVIAGPSEICLNDAAVFSISQLPIEAIIDWTVGPGLAANSFDQGRILEVTNWSSAGQYEICPTIQLNPPSGNVVDTCLMIEVLEAPQINQITNDTLLCPMDEITIAIAGSLFDEVQWQNGFSQLSCLNCLDPTFVMGTESVSLAVVFINSATGCQEQRIIEIGLQDAALCMTPVNNLEVISSVMVHPNPASKILYLKNNAPNNSIQIYAANGQLVEQYVDVQQSIDVSALTRGVYFLHIEMEEGSSQIIPWVKQD